MNYLLMLIPFYLFIKNTAFSYDNTKVKSCETCKWFNPNTIRETHGLCSLFKEKIYIADQERIICNFAQHCRDNEFLCGSEGSMHEDKNSDVTLEEKFQEFENKYSDYIRDMKEINIGHGEINEKQDIDELNNMDKELENLSKEALALLFKVKKHNQKKISIALDKVDYLYKKFKK